MKSFIISGSIFKWLTRSPFRWGFTAEKLWVKLISFLFLGMQMPCKLENFSNEPSWQEKLISDVMFKFFWHHQKSIADLKIKHEPNLWRHNLSTFAKGHCCCCFVSCHRIIASYNVWMRYRLMIYRLWKVHFYPQLLAVSRILRGKLHERLTEQLKWRSGIWDMIWSIYLAVLVYKLTVFSHFLSLKWALPSDKRRTLRYPHWNKCLIFKCGTY